MRMLVVEDDMQLRKQLVQHFQDQGWVVAEAGTGADARYLVEQYPCDLAVVDLGLPDISGIALITAWRESGCDFPVLILTARADWQDKVRGLEAGADDYVTKPFYLEEVAARVDALVRRVSGRSTAQIDYGVIGIDFSARSVSRHGVPVELTSYEYNTLAYLAHRAGMIVSKSELTEHLYDQDHDRDSNVLEVFVGRLRRKLDPEGNLQPIVTVRGAGYRFVLQPVGG
ncbi:DNA-binding response regulator [Kineobactrum sediminis]|uniref:DNA-binding response regulator n=1 Tax=Kineobactrum sediminis TaxID=1905677 RepID=A0A2N5Y0X0_9GAMM|nr:response regulator transcription factor [Kineobactrum sediminis]PLW82038.1 DNA-binding response regulator [Kineobactrum sediminis]